MLVTSGPDVAALMHHHPFIPLLMPVQVAGKDTSPGSSPARALQVPVSSAGGSLQQPLLLLIDLLSGMRWLQMIA